MLKIVTPIDESDFRHIMETQVEPFLEKRRNDSFFESFDGKNIHYECYISDNAKANIVISHGFTESAEKFREMAYYFINSGFNVFSVDHRGHGHSYRIKDRNETVCIDKFTDYIEDMHIFTKQIVKPSADLPMYIYGHSMGGGIAAEYLQLHNDVFTKAVLSSPMICAQTGVPVPIAKKVMGLLGATPLKHISVPGMCKFNPDATYENSSDTSKARFDYYMAKKIKEPDYRTAGPSFGWTDEALKLTDRLLDDERCKRITAKVLIFQPEQDKKVISSYQDIFASKVADAEIIHVKGSKHEIFNTTNDVLEGYLNKIISFFEKP